MSKYTWPPTPSSAEIALPGLGSQPGPLEGPSIGTSKNPCRNWGRPRLTPVDAWERAGDSPWAPASERDELPAQHRDPAMAPDWPRSMANQSVPSHAEAEELIEQTRKGAYQEPVSRSSNIRQVPSSAFKMHGVGPCVSGPGAANMSQCRATPCSESFWNNEYALLPVAEKRSACFR